MHAVELTKLERQKQELLTESDLNRQILRLEIDQVRARVGQVRHSFSWVHSSWRWIAPVVALFAARRLKGKGKLLSRGPLWLLLLRKFWEGFQAGRGRTGG